MSFSSKVSEEKCAWFDEKQRALTLLRATTLAFRLQDKSYPTKGTKRKLGQRVFIPPGIPIILFL